MTTPRVCLCFYGPIVSWETVKQSCLENMCFYSKDGKFERLFPEVFIHTYDHPSITDTNTGKYKYEEIYMTFSIFNPVSIEIEEINDKWISDRHTEADRFNTIKGPGDCNVFMFDSYCHMRKAEISYNKIKDFETNNGFRYDIIVMVNPNNKYNSKLDLSLVLKNPDHLLLMNTEGQPEPSDSVVAGTSLMMELFSKRLSVLEDIKCCSDSPFGQIHICPHIMLRYTLFKLTGKDWLWKTVNN